MDSRTPRDGRVLEELGTYDPMVPHEDARALILAERVKYWLGVGALPTEKVKVLLKKYGPEGTHLEAQKAALDRLAQERRRVVAPPPVADAEVEPAVEPEAEPAPSEPQSGPEAAAE
jgi:small subunit ribosomal protein S16